MNPRLTNKRLVKVLMDEKGIDMISISSNTIVVQVSESFTPAKAEDLCRRVGHAQGVKAVTREGLNYMIFQRY